MRRQYRVVIDVDAEVMELTLQRVLRTRAERAARWDDSVPAPLAALPTVCSLERQALLLRQLLGSPTSLSHYLRVGVMQELTIGGIPERYEQTLHDEEFFLPLIESLPPRERHYFREALASGRFVEDNEEFFDSFAFEVSRVTVLEVP
jgi:hypothetical protein